jgi:hypothetical protein
VSDMLPNKKKTKTKMTGSDAYISDIEAEAESIESRLVIHSRWLGKH